MAGIEATIFLSGSRLCKQDHTSRSYQSLREPFFDLMEFNDETLATGASVKHEVDGNLILLPLVGEIECNSMKIAPGQVMVVDKYVEVVNPYKNNLVNFLYVRLHAPMQHGIHNFNMDATRDKLIPVLPGMSIGKFGGRCDGIYNPEHGATGVFAFVVEGVFEVQNRLLHARDGLALTNVSEVEFEALSNEAIILFLSTQAHRL